MLTSCPCSCPPHLRHTRTGQLGENSSVAIHTYTSISAATPSYPSGPSFMAVSSECQHPPSGELILSTRHYLLTQLALVTPELATNDIHSTCIIAFIIGGYAMSTEGVPGAAHKLKHKLALHLSLQGLGFCPLPPQTYHLQPQRITFLPNRWLTWKYNSV